MVLMGTDDALTSTSAVEVRPLTPQDWPAVEACYLAGIRGGQATFETEPPTWQAFDAGKIPGLRFVAVADGEVVGWVAASRTSARPAYVGVVEHSIYVLPQAQGRGVGRLLLERFLAEAAAAGIWTVQSGIFPENSASLALHRRAGFREVGVRERIARMPIGPLAGQWRDVLLLELRLPEQESA